MYKIPILLIIAVTSARAENFSTAPIINPTEQQVSTANQAGGIAPIAASGLVEKQHAIIIDVREANEVAAISIPGALNIPLSQLKNRLVELDAYKQSPVITQCRTGRRSLEAMKILASSGFTHVQNLEGGIVAWEKAGLKTEKKCC